MIKRFIFYAYLFFFINIPNQAQFNLFSYNQQPSKYAIEQWQKVLDNSDYNGPIIQIYANYYVPNAMAISVPIYQQMWIQYGPYPGQGRYEPRIVGYTRLILYNPTFFTQTGFQSGNKFVGLGILAHELGHHKKNHSDSPNWWDYNKHPWEKEIEADFYSGEILAKLGAKGEDLIALHRLMFSTWGSPSHPDSFRRIQGISKGYIAGGGKDEVETELMDLYKKLSKELIQWHPGS